MLPTMPNDTDLELARAALQNIAEMTEGDILRACATLQDRGTHDDREIAAHIVGLIESGESHRIEQDGNITIYPAVNGMAEGVL